MEIVKIKRISKIISKAKKYDISVAVNHNFFASGILVHNCSIYRDHMHARSIDSKDHISRHWIKNFVSSFQHEIPAGWRITAENLYAKHSIWYNGLPSYLFVFGIFNEKNVYLSWDEVKEYSQVLHLENVPVLYRGIWDDDKVKACFTGKSVFGDSEQEGYVVRLAKEFPFSKFAKCTAKFVRKSHVQTSDFWMTQPVVPNRFRA